MTHSEAIAAAERAAQAAFAGEAVRWTAGLRGARAEWLARMVAADPEASAARLYRLVTGSDLVAPPWEQAPLRLRVALEVFRASYLALRRLVEADAAELRR